MTGDISVVQATAAKGFATTILITGRTSRTVEDHLSYQSFASAIEIDIFQ